MTYFTLILNLFVTLLVKLMFNVETYLFGPFKFKLIKLKRKDQQSY